MLEYAPVVFSKTYMYFAHLKQSIFQKLHLMYMYIYKEQFLH